MDPLLMAGAWAAALLSIAAITKLVANAVVRGIRSIFQQELQRVWRDMDDIEARLSALEQSLQYLRQQIEQLRTMMQAHVEER
jgi:septal ring factor EnvC (AmiA/AmiB activator)